MTAMRLLLGSTILGLLTLTARGGGAQTAGLAAALAGGHTPFIIGAPGRIDAPGDQRAPRRHAGIESSVGAYADVESLRDDTWLAHELVAYVRRRGACRDGGIACGYRTRLIGAHAVLALARGHRAEIVWRSGRHAVRLGWHRLVETATGTMTVEDPPADFAAALFAAYPSDLAAAPVDVARWDEDEPDRLAYYAERALAEWPAGDGVRAAAMWRNVRRTLALLARREPRFIDVVSGEHSLPRALLHDRLREWRAARQAARQSFASLPLWCPAQPAEPPLLPYELAAQNGMSSSP